MALDIRPTWPVLVLGLVACGGTEPPRAPLPPSTTVATAPDAAPAPEPSAPLDAAPEPAFALPEQKTELPLPGEPWYRDQAARDEECVAPLAQVPTRHFPAPFEACDPHVESFASPPGGPELHFHYRDFSPALTRTHRASSATTCCYMIFEFPRRHR